MSRFIQGEPRTQSTLFPARIEEYISEDNPVKFIDAFIEQTDLVELGFASAQPHATGRPAYHPGLMFKLYSERTNECIYF